jgi:hypothetical protein
LCVFRLTHFFLLILDLSLSISKKRIRWAGNVARMGDSRGGYRVLTNRPDERDHWEH